MPALNDVQTAEIKEAVELIEQNYVPYGEAAQILGTHLAYARTMITSRATPGGVDIIDLHGKPLIRKEFLTDIQEARAANQEKRSSVSEEKVKIKEGKEAARAQRAQDREAARVAKAEAKVKAQAEREAAAQAAAEAKAQAKAEAAAQAEAARLAAMAAANAQPAEEELEAEPA